MSLTKKILGIGVASLMLGGIAYGKTIKADGYAVPDLSNPVLKEEPLMVDFIDSIEGKETAITHYEFDDHQVWEMKVNNHLFGYLIEEDKDCDLHEGEKPEHDGACLECYHDHSLNEYAIMDMDGDGKFESKYHDTVEDKKELEAEFPPAWLLK